MYLALVYTSSTRLIYWYMLLCVRVLVYELLGLEMVKAVVLVWEHWCVACERVRARAVRRPTMPSRYRRIYGLLLKLHHAMS